MRRALAWLGIVLAVGGFVVLALSIWLNIYWLIPVGMILGAFIILMIVKNMPSDIPDEAGEKREQSDE